MRSAVAAEVRAAMARARINPTQLARMTGKSQTYWWRRVVAVETALDVDDLATVAGILGVRISDLIPDDEGPRPGASRDEGMVGQRARRDSNPQPSDWEPAALFDLDDEDAHVVPFPAAGLLVDLDEYRAARRIS